MLFDFEVPEEILGGALGPDVIANGPFVVERQGEPTLGIQLERNGDDVQYFNGGSVVVMDETFTTKLEGDEIVASSDQYDAVWVIRPVTFEDADWIMDLLDPEDEEDPQDLDQLTDTIREALYSGM